MTLGAKSRYKRRSQMTRSTAMAGQKPTLRATDFAPEVLRLFDKYVHGALDRRGFLDRAAKFAAAGGVSAAALLEALSPKFAEAQQVAPADPRIKIETRTFDSPQGYGKGRGYLARPAAAGAALPVVLVVHENRGLNPHIEDVARRLALDDFIAYAPDALFPLGGYPGDEDRARDLFGRLDQAKTRADFRAAAAFAQGVAGGNGKLGAVGFCYGGGIVNMLATQLPDLGAAVPFYGAPPPLERVAAIKAPLLLFFAGEDERLNALWPPYAAALKAAHVRFEATTYPGVQHGFNNDTTPRYDAVAAKQAWDRTLALFNRTLRA
jgi:carboxymethylenebutenolidase